MFAAREMISSPSYLAKEKKTRVIPIHIRRKVYAQTLRESLLEGTLRNLNIIRTSEVLLGIKRRVLTF